MHPHNWKYGAYTDRDVFDELTDLEGDDEEDERDVEKLVSQVGGLLKN